MYRTAAVANSESLNDTNFVDLFVIKGLLRCLKQRWFRGLSVTLAVNGRSGAIF